MITAIKAIILHTFRVQVDPNLSSRRRFGKAFDDAIAAVQGTGRLRKPRVECKPQINEPPPHSRDHNIGNLICRPLKGGDFFNHGSKVGFKGLGFTSQGSVEFRV